ncbi:MAG: hypothetical protein WD066_08250 [Planctomycetaceae bacterium]
MFPDFRWSIASSQNDMIGSSKITEGALYLGLLGHTGYLAEVTRPWAPAWLVIGIIIVPVAVFIMIPADEDAGRHARWLHFFGATWYLGLTGVVLAICLLGHRPEGWMLMLTLIVPGMLASLWLLVQSSPHEEHHE